MKRFLLTAVLVMSLVFAVGCGGDPAPKQTGDEGTGALKTGLAILSSVEKSTAAGAEDGLAQTDSVAIGVLVDEKGVIVKCIIDTAQTKINFSKDGKLITPLDTVVPTKLEMGDDYGMHVKSSLGKDWADQITAFCAYVEGKTVEEVKGISVSETTAPTDEELASSVTIKIGDYISGIEKAVANATDCGAKAEDTLGLGIVTNISKSKDVSADAEGLAQAYSTYALASFDAEGKVTSCIIDGSQSNVNFDKTGGITTDLAVPPQTKNQLGEEYGLKGKSGIGKEWNEQAAAYAAYALGKTPQELSGMSLTEGGAPADAELASSVTVSVGNFNSCLERAAAIAR